MNDPLREEAERLGMEGDVIPHDVIPVPCGAITLTKSADIIFRAAGEKRRMFMRGGLVHEVRERGEDVLEVVKPARFCSMVEKLGKRIAGREQLKDADGKTRMVWRQRTFPKTSADQVLLTDEAGIHLPHIRQLANCPILTPAGLVLGKGYHDYNGGTYVSGGVMPLEIELSAAVELLKDTLSDFDFASSGDASRAVASLISPALKMGGWITDDFPLDLAEADKSQSGKTYRQKSVCLIYRETPSTITKADGGVGSLDESIAVAMGQGRPFINIGNFRGTLSSQILEESLRGSRQVQLRLPGGATPTVDTTVFLWQLSTNGAELTRDMANRSIITRIRKRDDTHRFRRYTEGDLHACIVARQPCYLGAVFAVLRAWKEAGCALTDERRHDFRGWVQALDWIVQNIFKMDPLLDGHREEQLRCANPKLQWLRDIVVAIVSDGYNGEQLTASDIADAADDHDKQPPGRRDSQEAASMRVGRTLGNIFKDVGADVVTVDGYLVTRHMEQTWDSLKRTMRDSKHYMIKLPPPIL